MSDFGTVGMAGTAVAINTVYTLQHGRDPFPVLFAGALFTGAVVLVSAGTPELGTALAGLFLLATFLTRGETFMTWLTDLLKGSEK
jgi:hypothetical protein